jgi:hypothetical protein
VFWPVPFRGIGGDRLQGQYLLAYARELSLSAGTRVIVHPNDWQWGPDERDVWREHHGQGYWRGDDWVEF